MAMLLSYGPVLNYLKEIIDEENLNLSLINARYISN